MSRIDTINAQRRGHVITVEKARHTVTSLVAALLAAGALGSCARESRQASVAPADSTAASASVAVDTASIEIASVDGPGVLNIVRQAGTPVALVNVWATWCAPCREEFPDLMRAARERRARGLALVLVSADFEDQVSGAKRFLARHGAGFKSYLKTGDDMAFIESLSHQWSGSLPATFLFDRTGHLIDFWEGRATYEDMSRRIDHALEVARATLPS
jgi:thiol-disulfide isomerase/thioredoxin